MKKQVEHHPSTSNARGEPNAFKDENLFSKQNDYRNKNRHDVATEEQELANHVPVRYERGSAYPPFNRGHPSLDLSYQLDTPTSHPAHRASGWGYPPSDVSAGLHQCYDRGYNHSQQPSRPAVRPVMSSYLPASSHAYRPPQGDSAAGAVSSGSTYPATTHGRHGISVKILKEAQRLNLPKRGKFSLQNWKDALALMYRWKTTIDETELQQFGTSTKSNGRSLSMSKSVNRFCDGVLQCKTKRRMFNDHWNGSGLKRMVEHHDEGSYPPFDGVWLKSLLDDYFSDQKRKNAYRLARQHALKDRQQQINATWKEMMNEVPCLTVGHLSRLQTLIESPYSKTIEVVVDGKRTRHAVKIDGFDGQTATKMGTKRQQEVEPSPIEKFGQETQSILEPTENTNTSEQQQRLLDHEKENAPFAQNRTSV